MGKLSERDARILSAIQHSAQTPLTEIAKNTHCRIHVVRAAVQSLIKRKLAQPVAAVDTGLLGYHSYDINFSIAAKNSKVRAAFEESVIASPQVSHFTELGAQFDYSLKIWVGRKSEVSVFFDRFTEKFGEIFLRRTLAIEQYYIGFGRKYLGAFPLPPHIIVTDKAAPIEIDDLDHRILQCITIPPLKTPSEIARTLGQPTSTIEYRIRSLEKNKIISAYVYRIACESLGYQRYRILFTMQTFSKKTRDEFVKFCALHPHIINLYYTLGSWDFDIGVEVKDHANLRSIIRECNDIFGSHIHEVSILPIYKILKMNGYPFLKRT